MAGEREAIIIDNGSGMLKIGIGGEDAPQHMIPSIVGYSDGREVVAGQTLSDYYCAEEMKEKRAILRLVHPLQSGIVEDWAAMENLWEYSLYNKLRKDPSEFNMVLTEAALNPGVNREKMAEIMFEKFNVPALHIAVQGVCVIYASGHVSGFVIDIGDGVTHVVPVFQGSVVETGVDKVMLAGRELTGYMAQELLQQNIDMRSAAELETVAKMKEESCYVAPDFAAEMAKAEDSVVKPYTLPSGKQISLGRLRFKVPEQIFNPTHIGDGTRAKLVDVVRDSITKKCPLDTQSSLWSGIFLSGGSTLFPGFSDRLQTELTKVAPSPVTVNAPAERQYSVWIGASIMSKLTNFDEKLVTVDTYHERGTYSVDQ